MSLMIFAHSLPSRRSIKTDENFFCFERDFDGVLYARALESLQKEDSPLTMRYYELDTKWTRLHVPNLLARFTNQVRFYATDILRQDAIEQSTTLA